MNKVYEMHMLSTEKKSSTLSETKDERLHLMKPVEEYE